MFSFIALRPPPMELTLAGRAKCIFSYPELAIQLSGWLTGEREAHRKRRGRAKGLCAPLDGGSRQGGSFHGCSMYFSCLFLNIYPEVLLFSKQQNMPIDYNLSQCGDASKDSTDGQNLENMSVNTRGGHPVTPGEDMGAFTVSRLCHLT